MSYIGLTSAAAYDPTRAAVPQLDAERFSGTGSATTFTLSRSVVTPVDIDVFVENVRQEPTVAYNISDGTSLVFTSAPASGTNNIYVVYRGSGTSNYAFVPDGSITYAKLANNIKQFTQDIYTANGSVSSYTLTDTPASANTLVVAIDGVLQTAPANYTISGNTLTFTSTPDSGSTITIKHLGIRTTTTVTALTAGSVTTTELADGSVTTNKLASSAVTPIKIAANTAGTFLTTDGSSVIWKAQSALSIANTQITGNIISSQITSVANTQITGNIISSQITSVANTQLTGTTGTGYVTLNTSPVITTPTLTTPVVTNYTETTYTANTGTAITINLANGTLQNLTCNASTTITLPASSAGKSFIIIIGYAGAYTVSWSGGSTIKWPGGTTPTATSTSGKYDVFSFFQDGVNTYGQTFGLNY